MVMVGDQLPDSYYYAGRMLAPRDQDKILLQGKRLARIFHAPEVFIGKAFKGAAVVHLLQTLVHSTALKNGPANLANGQLRERPQGEIFGLRR